MDRKTIISAFVLTAVLACLIPAFFSCGSGQDTSSQSGGTGMVDLYFTDDAADYKEVLLTVHRVQLINSGNQVSCDLLEAPVALDIPRLADLMQFGNAASCPSGSYNRIHIELEQSLELMDKTGAFSGCRFTSYLDNSNQSNMLNCNSDTGICALDINGAVRRGALEILRDRNNKLSLDFDLKSFIVENFGDPSACSVALKVRPLEDSEIIQRRDKESISGAIVGLDTAARSCTLKKGSRPFAMTYGGISEAAQPGLNALLLTAQEMRFTALVQAAALDLEAYKVDATAISVTVRGLVQDLDLSAKTFALQYKPPDRTIMVSYDPSAVEGPLADTAKVEVALSGFDEVSGVYRAERVALRKTGRDPDN